MKIDYAAKEAARHEELMAAMDRVSGLADEAFRVANEVIENHKKQVRALVARNALLEAQVNQPRGAD